MYIYNNKMINVKVKVVNPALMICMWQCKMQSYGYGVSYWMVIPQCPHLFIHANAVSDTASLFLDAFLDLVMHYRWNWKQVSWFFEWRCYVLFSYDLTCLYFCHWDFGVAVGMSTWTAPSGGDISLIRSDLLAQKLLRTASSLDP